jgi:protein-S-isoprenylcysteine O-methyltransferase Ste14
MFVLMALLFFLPAGTLAYWQAWLWLATLYIPMSLVLAYLVRNDPGLLERRMRLRETQQTQQRLVQFGWIWLLLTFTVPGLDQRFGWTQVPTAVTVAAAVVMFLSYCLGAWVMRVNSYASRVIEVEQGQQVITSGPYAIVRHPLYVSALGIYLFSPLVLASYWAALPALLIIPFIIMRIRNEEQVLSRDLPGYAGYLQRVRYRLIPGIW